MTIDKSLKIRRGLIRSRNVLTRAERIAKLTASDAQAYDSFGRSVSISGDTAVVGANFDDDNGSASGSVYVFKRDGENWIEIQKLTASDGTELDYFGWSVSIDADSGYMLVGATGDEESAYLFKRAEDINDPNWYEAEKLTASDWVDGDYFASSVCINGQTGIVPAYGDEGNTGAAYIFEIAPCPEADLTGDCFVGLDDFAVMAEQWLQGVQ